MRPHHIGRYRVTRRLATGGMAELYLCSVEGALGYTRPVVVKQILPHLSRDPEFVQMFATEAKLATHLAHPNIVPILELGEHDERLFIAMEYVEGADLQQLARVMAQRGQHVPASLACAVADRVLAALDHAHNAVDAHRRPLCVVHRDISPSNLLLSRQGEVKVTDFGVALVGNHCPQGRVRGTFSYMSPEQARGDPVDPRSDLFSVGIVLAELLLGRRLFTAGSGAETLQRVRSVELGVLDQHEGEIPPVLVAILRRALRPDPADRFPSARAFQEALEDFLHQRRQWIAPRELARFAQIDVLPYVESAEPSPPWEEITAPIVECQPAARSDAEPRRLNCWDYHQCHRQEGPDPCPSATSSVYDGVNDGVNAGRVCWSVAGTLCAGVPRCSFVAKRESCLTCPFYERVLAEQGPADFQLIPEGGTDRG